MSFKLVFLGIILAIAEGHVLPKGKPGIIDGAGYAIRNAAYLEQELVMEATSPGADESIGKVLLHPFMNSRSQKWGVEFFGGCTASLSSGMFRENHVTVYLPPGSSRHQSRQYTFHSLDDNETFQIRNSETKMCLNARPSDGSSSSIIVVGFTDCMAQDPTSFWVFQRTG